MTEDAKSRALDKMARLAAEPRSLVSFWQECSEVLSSALPFYDQPCWYTVDPASLLITSHYNPNMPALPPEWLAMEYYDADDVNKVADIARSSTGLSTLHEATGGDPSATARWQANIEYGGDQELIAALRTPNGETWGALGLYREAGADMFDASEQQFLREAAAHAAQGARRSLLFGEATDPEGPQPPGLLILTKDWQVESRTPGAELWLDDLPDGDIQAGRLPSAVLSVAGRALREARSGDAGDVALARVLTRSGTWVVLHGAVLQSGTDHRVAVIVEPAHPARITALLMSAYGLTDRERDVTRLVLQGCSTTEIAAEMVVSPHTVQQHLKSVFDKTRVRSRRALVGKVFFSHYEPRLRDNEQRALLDKPLRGGPILQAVAAH
ncbi:MAG: helix-turn-helix transcriptional regulator [Actinomycetota bacterium]|nr:helix-turn-helix transcriptional regulator [Actinomycetota bacterium]